MEDLSGKKYGRWTVIKYSHKDSTSRSFWLCECDCGNRKAIRTIALNNGSSTSCGCFRSELSSVRNKALQDERRESVIGRIFDRLTVIGLSHISKYRESYYTCRCECGNVTVVAGGSLNGHTRSCGCLNIENKTTHGLSHHPLYQIWVNMCRRCTNENDVSFENYGKRNIQVCWEWLNSVETFYNWAIQNGFKPGLTIERIDVNGNYCPENCTWIPGEMQARNTRRTKLNTDTVRDIRESDKSPKYLSEKYNVSVSHISNVRTQRAWKDT